MDTIISNIQNFMPYIIITLSVIILLFLILIIVLFRSLSKVERKYRKLMRGVNDKNLEEHVISYLDKIDEANKTSEAALEHCSVIEERMKGCVQKVSMIRYKAFEDVGSDLSFSIAILDDNNDGIILTGIYSRNDSTTYAKPVDKGISRYDLSEEELTVLNQAINRVNIH